MDRELLISPWPEWEIVEKIGEGSFGRVYKAQRTVRGHSFYSAIKVISIPYSSEELTSVLSETGDPAAARKYFEGLMEECLQEISTMEFFRGNSHLVSVEDFQVTEYLDEIGWDIYIRMEYLTSFQEYCVGRTMTEAEVIRLGIHIARALECCDHLDIIHRDVKPENIFVTRFGDFKLGDFGIARKLEETVGSFSKKGTYSYMAPEIYRGDGAYTEQADLYSLGLVLYKLMNKNRLPFLSLDKQLITYHDKETALGRRMAGEMLPPPSTAGEAFSKVILKACAYSPQDRYASATELRKALETLRWGARADAVEKKKGSTLAERRQKCREARQDRKARRQTEENGRRFASNARWIIAIIVVAAIAVVSSALMMRLMLEDAVKAQAKIMVASLDNSSSEISEEEAGMDFATSIQLIRDRVTEIVDELPQDRIVGQEGERIAYFNGDGEVRKVLVYPGLSSEGLYEEYYYWDSSLAFAYIWGENGPVDMYYYRDGILIRWIDSDQIIHDNEIENPEFIYRGDKYWTNSLAELDIVGWDEQEW